jgi:hypothetical protein
LPPEPQPLAGNIVDVVSSWGEGNFALASTNPSRVRVVVPRWPNLTEDWNIPLTAVPTKIGSDEDGTHISVIHDSTWLALVSFPNLMQVGDMNVGVPLFDARGGGATPRVYPAQAGQIQFADPVSGMIWPGGAISGPSRGRQSPDANRALYVLTLGAANTMRRYDGADEQTSFVRSWPYTAGQYPLGSDLFLYHDWIIASTGHVFGQSDDPTMDMIHSTVLAGDQPFEIVGVTGTQTHLVVLADRITVGPEQPETQIRFYNQLTLALEHVEYIPDYLVAGVPQRVVGHAISATAMPGYVFVVGSAGTSWALFTIPEWP